MCGGSGTTTTTNVGKQNFETNTNKEFQKYFEFLAKESKNAYGQASTKPYGGDFVSLAGKNEIGAAQGIQQIGQNYANPVAKAAGDLTKTAGDYKGAGTGLLQLAQDQIAGKYLDPKNDVNRNALEAATRPIEDVYNQNMKRLQSTASAQGASGNSLARGLERDLTSSFNRDAGDVGARMMYDVVNRERQIQQNSGQLIAQSSMLEGIPLQMLGQAAGAEKGVQEMIGRGGEIERSLEALNVLNNLSKYQEQGSAPYRALMPFSQLLGSIPTLTSEGKGLSINTSTGPAPASSNPFLGGMQGALGGASLLGGMVPGMQWLPLAGAALGAAGGAWGASSR